MTVPKEFHLADPDYDLLGTKPIQCIKCGEVLYDASQRRKDWNFYFTSSVKIWDEHIWRCIHVQRGREADARIPPIREE